jgi:hypothetical protein
VDADLQMIKEVKDTMHMWVLMQPEIFFTDGIKKLVPK